MPDRPIITVERRRGQGTVVECSLCGLLCDQQDRSWAQYRAHRHAQDVHDGDVTRSGWT